MIVVLTADTRRLRADLHPATVPDAAQPTKLHASPRCPTRPKMAKFKPGASLTLDNTWGQRHLRSPYARRMQASGQN